MPALRILIDDDDPALRAALAEVLDSAGYEVTQDGGEFDLVLTSKPDWVGRKVLLTKPLRMGALFAAIEQACAGAEICFGPWRLDENGRVLDSEDGVKQRLTDKEAALLAYLGKAGAAVEREALLAEIWGYGEQISTHTLETHIYKLRQKIETDPAQPQYLITEAGGYRLVVDSGG